MVSDPESSASFEKNHLMLGELGSAAGALEARECLLSAWEPLRRLGPRRSRLVADLVRRGQLGTSAQDGAGLQSRNVKLNSYQIQCK
jgi:hypothetical protein